MAPSNTVQPAPPRISARDAKFATVLVGDEAARFVVHEELLTYHSPYFRAALKGGFSEAADGAVHLQEVDPVMFEVLVHWLYHARLPNQDDAPELFEPWTRLEECKKRPFNSVVRLYVLSDTYDVPALRRHCMDQLFLHYEDGNVGGPELDTIVYGFKNAPSDSPLCRFLIDYACHCLGDVTWSDACERQQTAPPLALLSSALQRYTDYSLGYLAPHEGLVACDYHEHKDKDERKR